MVFEEEMNVNHCHIYILEDMEVKSGQCLVAERYIIKADILDNIWHSLVISIGR